MINGGFLSDKMGYGKSAETGMGGHNLENVAAVTDWVAHFCKRSWVITDCDALRNRHFHRRVAAHVALQGQFAAKFHFLASTNVIKSHLPSFLFCSE